jgi:hypothetical protein
MLHIGYVPLLRLAIVLLLATGGQAQDSIPSLSPSPSPAVPDALGNNWDFAHAAPAVIGVTYDLSFVCPVADGCINGDHDFLRVPVKRDVIYVVGTFDLGPGADTVLDLFWGSEELPVASNDDAGPLGFASLLRWRAPGDGEAVVRVGPRNGALTSEGLGERAGSYRFAVAVEGSPLARQIEERIRAQTTLATATPTSIEPARTTPTAPRVFPPPPQAPPAPLAPTRPQTTTVTADTGASSGGPSINDGSTGRAVVVAPNAAVRVLPRQDSDVLQRLGEGTQVNLTGRTWGGWVRVVTDDGVMPGWSPAQGAQADTLSIQLLTPFGEPFAIPLTIAGVAQDEHRLGKGRQALAVEGQVRLVGTYDRRYAHEGEAQGRRTDTMQLLVRRVREPAAGEQVGSSFVELAGAVADLPVFRDHPHLPGVEYALLTLDVTERRAPPFPGSKIVREATHKVRVAVLTRTPGAGLLYRPGNRVRLQGELDCVLVSGLPHSGAAEVLGRVQAEWAEQDARLREQPELLRSQPVCATRPTGATWPGCATWRARRAGGCWPGTSSRWTSTPVC